MQHLPISTFSTFSCPSLSNQLFHPPFCLPIPPLKQILQMLESDKDSSIPSMPPKAAKTAPKGWQQKRDEDVMNVSVCPSSACSSTDIIRRTIAALLPNAAFQICICRMSLTSTSPLSGRALGGIPSSTGTLATTEQSSSD